MSVRSIPRSSGTGHLHQQAILSFFALLLLTVFLFKTNALAAVEQGEKYALVVGVNEYRLFPPLNYAVTDATLLAQQLKAQGYTVKLLTDYAVDPDHVLATLNAIGQLMDAGTGRENGTLIFAFSGHGFQQDGENFLAMGRADPNNLQGTTLSMQRIKATLSRSKIGRSMLFIDACRNDPGKSEPDNSRRFALDDAADGVAILYSTGSGELSWEDQKIEQGVFSHYLVRGLGGNALNNSGLITFDSLYQYVRREVSRHVFDRYDRRQVPYIAGERSGDFIVGHARSNAGIASNSPINNLTIIGEQSGGDVPATKLKSSNGWRKALTVLGILALGALAAGASSGGDSSTGENVTLVVPTP